MKASYSGVRSTFVNVYRMIGETMPKEFKIDLSQFVSGMKRTVASQKAESGEMLDEGKKSMRYEVYKKLFYFLFEREGVDYVFTHVFIMLEWNLLA